MLFVYDQTNPNKSYRVKLNDDDGSHVGGITYDKENNVLLDLTKRDYSSLKLKSNININYNTLENGEKETAYNAATIYYDTEKHIL